MVLAVIGTAALWLTFVWLASAIVASLFSDAKGYGEKLGLITGTVLSVFGAFAWAVIPPREISRWKLHGGLSPAARTALIGVEIVLVIGAAFAVTQVDASSAGRIALVLLSLAILIIAAALVYTIDIRQATGGKTMAELRTERQIIE